MGKINRDTIQAEILTGSNAELVVLSLCTGLGKSLSAIQIQDKHKPKDTFITVAETAHIQGWKDEYLKHGYENLLHSTEIFCYASLKNYANTEVDMWIFDEWHHLVTALRIGIISTVKAKKIVCLSATCNSDDLLILKTALKEADKPTYLHTVTLKQAIEWGVLPKPQFYLIPLELEKYNTTEIIEIRRDKKNPKIINCSYINRWPYMKDRVAFPNINIKCTPKEKIEWFDSQIEYFKELIYQQGNNRFKQKMLRLGSERKRYLGNLKTKWVKQLIDKIPKEFKYICFCSSIDQAKELGSTSTVVNSKVKDPQKIINKFQNDGINSLFLVGMLTEGANLAGIQGGIIVQLDSKDRLFIQKTGRVFRAEDPIQFIFYFKNTQDEVYLNKIMEHIDPQYINTIHSLQNFELDV